MVQGWRTRQSTAVVSSCIEGCRVARAVPVKRIDLVLSMAYE